MKVIKKLSLLGLCLLSTTLLFANAGVEFAQGPITKLTVSNENNQEPGFTVCVKDLQFGEVCMWRRYSTNYNYQQLLDVANTAILAKKNIGIQANVVGSLDSITVFN